MEVFPMQAIIPIGVILAAFIGGFFTLISLIISKEQKTSEFRQEWIDDLRQEISDHIAALTMLSAMRQYQTVSDEDFLKSVSEEQQRVTTTFTAIKLRINPSESNNNLKQLNNNFLTKLEYCRSLYNDSDWEGARRCCNELTDAAVPMLKAEWERVKQGENTYILTKRIAIGITVLALLGVIWLTFKAYPTYSQIS
tara:strand:+ start:201 stop:788 length:588 start_codon:yes stop_codon:yes gene_type:complete